MQGLPKESAPRRKDDAVFEVHRLRAVGRMAE